LTKFSDKVKSEHSWFVQFAKLKEIAEIAQDEDLFYTHYALYVLKRIAPVDNFSFQSITV